MRYGRLRHVLGSTRGFTRMVSGNIVTLLHDGERALPAMLDAIRAASHEILLEMYWFGSDQTGSMFADALIERAQAGVRVNVIYDAVGSWDTSPKLFARLREGGCEVVEYNPIAPWRRQFRIGVVNSRNHRKMLIVDRRVGFTGGVNLADRWAPKAEGGDGWRDDMVRIEGPSVNQMRTIFEYAWREVTEDVRARMTSVPPPPLDTEEANSRVRVLANHFFGERRAIRRAYLQRIRSARRYVYITNSYFVPDGRIRRALEQAVERGVDVRVIVPGKSDVPAVLYAARYLYQGLLEAGISLHEWQGQTLHAKTAVIDGQWCTVGTYNLDYRSWRFNLEVTAAIEDPHVAQAMQDRFEHDLAQTTAISADAWPQRSWAGRVLEAFFFLFRKML